MRPFRVECSLDGCGRRWAVYFAETACLSRSLVYSTSLHTATTEPSVQNTISSITSVRATASQPSRP